MTEMERYERALDKLPDAGLWLFQSGHDPRFPHQLDRGAVPPDILAVLRLGGIVLAWGPNGQRIPIYYGHEPPRWMDCLDGDGPWLAVQIVGSWRLLLDEPRGASHG